MWVFEIRTHSEKNRLIKSAQPGWQVNKLKPVEIFHNLRVTLGPVHDDDDNDDKDFLHLNGCKVAFYANTSTSMNELIDGWMDRDSTERGKSVHLLLVNWIKINIFHPRKKKTQLYDSELNSV